MQVDFVVDWGLFKLNKAIVHNTFNLQATNLLTTQLICHHITRTQRRTYTHIVSQPNSGPKHILCIAVDAKRHTHPATCHHHPASPRSAPVCISCSFQRQLAVMLPCFPFLQTYCNHLMANNVTSIYCGTMFLNNATHDDMPGAGA